MKRSHGSRRWTLFALLALAGAAGAQADARQATRLPRVAILGASVSGGFSDQFMTAESAADREHNQTVRLAELLPQWWDDPDLASIRDLSNLAMFQDPERIGRLQVDRALRAEPDLVLALDYLFWFGYSVRGGDRARRLELQQQGLAQLARIDAPLLVGDYPVMGDVDPRMMPQRAVPDADTLRLLNENLRAWAAARPHVRIFPLATLVETLRAQPRDVEVQGRTYRVRPQDLLQTDRLHATRLGMAVLLEQVGEAVRGMLPAEAKLRPRVRTLAQLVTDLGYVDLVLQAPLVEGEPPVETAGRGKR